MFLSRKQITVLTVALIIAADHVPHASAQDASNERDRVVEAFGFRNISPFKDGDINVDPFEYRGDPIPFNSFLLSPNITLQQEYNDNVLATENDTKNDFATIIKPELTVQKAVGRHNFLARIQSEIRRYWDLSSENIENYHARFQANLEAKTGFDIPILVSYTDGHLERRNQKRANVADLTTKPLAVKALSAESGFIYNPNRFTLSFLGNYAQQRLENARRFDGSSLTRDNRNVNALKFALQTSYDLPSGVTPYARVEYKDEDYINESPSAISRDNDQVKLLFGSAFDFKGLVYGFMSAGYETRTYSDSRVDDASGLALHGGVTWEPRAKTKLSLDLSRETFEDNVLVAGITETYLALELAHELQKDFFAKFGVSYENEDFNDTSREDDTYEAKASLVYIANSRLQLGAEYTFATRDSTVEGLGLDNNIFMVRATAAW